MKTFKYVLLLILLNIGFGYAQLFTTNNINVFIANGTQLTVQGDFQNANGATITNNGTIDLSGNWIHNAANNCFGLGVSTGTVIFNGANQTIGGLNPTTFNNLTLVGTGTKTLLQDIVVGGASSPTGVLSIGDRYLDLNSKMLTISNPLPLAMVRNTGFIISETAAVPGYGYIRWNISNSSAGNNYVFPFGNSATTSYLPFGFNITTAGAGAGYVKLATYPTITTANPNNRPLPTGLTVLENNSGAENATKVLDRYFIFDVGNYSTSPVSTMSFPYRDSEWSTGNNSIIEANLRLQRLNNGVAWIQPPFGSVNTANNFVTATAQNIYSTIWTIVDLTSPLPIELLEFKATLNTNQQTDLVWTTAAENNSLNFEVQKSKDALNFETIETVESHHFSNSVSTYKTIDPNPFDGITYYRLKHNDYNGEFTFSQTVSVNSKLNTNFEMHMYPNPFSEFTTIQIISDNALNPETRLTITNQLGQIMQQLKLGTLPRIGKTVIYKLSKGSLASGFYNLSVYDNERRIGVIKMAVQ